jgi:hypothetical protein
MRPWLLLACLCICSTWTAAANDSTAPGKDADSVAKIDELVIVDPIAEDQKAIQGKWTTEITSGDGEVFQIEKVVTGNSDVYSEYDANGNLIHAHTAEFRLSRDGQTRVFTFFNYEITAGQNVGFRNPKPRSFLYRIDDDVMYEVWGLRESDASSRLNVMVWTRKK